MPDVARIIKRHNIGTVVDPNTATNWETSILKVLNKKSDLQENVLEANKILCWENKEQPFYEFLGKPKSVTFLSVDRDLLAYQRFNRMARTLTGLNCRCNFFGRAFGHSKERIEKITQISYYF